MDIREIDGLWCDDITFCPERCGWKSCPRNKENIRDRTIPHSFSVEIPSDCPKQRGEIVDREKVIKGLQNLREAIATDFIHEADQAVGTIDDALALLKEQEKKQITIHKRHVITWKRDDEFTMRKLYEAVCETLMDEGELVIVRIDDHEKVSFTFYVMHEDT